MSDFTPLIFAMFVALPTILFFNGAKVQMKDCSTKVKQAECTKDKSMWRNIMGGVFFYFVVLAFIAFITPKKS